MKPLHSIQSLGELNLADIIAEIDGEIKNSGIWKTSARSVKASCYLNKISSVTKEISAAAKPVVNFIDNVSESTARFSHPVQGYLRNVKCF